MPVSERCQETLKAPATREVCEDFRAIRQRVMCSAWKIVEEEGRPFREAVRTSWDRRRTECSAVGVFSPERAEVEKAVELLDVGGMPVGAVSLMSDGRVEFCHRTMGCDVTEKPSPEAFYLAQAFFSSVYGYGIRPLSE